MSEACVYRITQRVRERVTNDLLEGLVLIERAMGKDRSLSSLSRPPVLLAEGFDSGAILEQYPNVAPFSFDESFLMLGNTGRVTGGAQLHVLSARRTSAGASGHTRFFWFKKQRVTLLTARFRWPARGTAYVGAGEGLLTRDDNGWLTGDFDFVDAMRRYREASPTVFFAIDGLALEIPCSLPFVRRLLATRDKGEFRTRRAALRHFVDNYFRDQETTEDDEIWVRKHLRGTVECQWGGFCVLLNPPSSWGQEAEMWKEERDAYSRLTPAERKRARNIIRSTYGLPVSSEVPR